MTQHVSTLMSLKPQAHRGDICEELFEPWVIDTDGVVSIVGC